MSESLALVNDEFSVEGNEDMPKVISRTALSKNAFTDEHPIPRETKVTSCVVRKSSTEMGENQDCSISSFSNLTGSENCLMNTVPASPSSFGSDVSTQVFTFQSELQALEQSLIREALQAENEFMHYALSIPKKVPDNQHGTIDSKKSSTEVSPKVGLDHLDNLCRLMEQLSELKEANFKLKKRVQYLEDLKSMHEIHREMLQLSSVQPLGILPSGLNIDQNSLLCPEMITDRSKSPSLEDDDDSSKDGLQRSKTTASVNTKLDHHTKQEHAHRSRNASKEVVRERSKSVGHPDHSKNKNRSSRWSKVKAVLGIEKADDIPQPQCEKKEYSKELKVHQEDNRTCRVSTPCGGRVSPNVRGHSSSSRNRHSTVITDEKGNDVFATSSSGNIRDQWNEGSKKYSKTPWGKMKTMIQSRRGDTRGLRANNGFTTSKSYTDVHAEACENDSQNVAKRNSRPSRKTSFGSQDTTKKSHSDAKNKSNTLELGEKLGGRATSVKEQSLKSSDKPTSKKINQDRPKSGDYSQNANEIRDASSGKLSCGDGKTSAGICSNSTTHKDGKIGLTTSIIKRDSSSKKENSGSKDDMKTTSPSQRKDKTPDIKRDSAGQDQVNVNDDATNSKNKEEHSALACTSATVTELLKELQQNLSDDFNKKLEEWHRFRNEGIKPVVSDVERKDSFGKLRKFSKPDKKSSTADKLVKHASIVQKKDLHWLEKELQKVEREIVRLSKEKQKFEKRALRLTCLKEAMTESQLKNEVLVKTSAGEFRFEGISNAFTKKLYEWETKKGVGPELSTIALLDESLKTQELQPRECRSITDIDKCSVTLNPDSERYAYRISKSSSEPDFSSLANTSKDSGSPKSAKRCQSGDTFLSFGNDSQASSSVKEELVDTEDVQISRALQSHSREDYCGLLEENIFLLDQLKEKEYVCAKLQSELDRLDEKAGKANMTHQEELEKYRQKLWEIHMSRPKDLQGSLQLISELKMRIEELHKCSDKLKSDREKLEESFRQHSEQQRLLSDDLINRITEMQENVSPSERAHGGRRRKNRQHCICGAASGVTRIHELSAKVLRQARDMEEALAERTRQVCHLRWELLLRDMSTVLLQAALHRVTYQGPQATLVPTWDMKRMKFKALKAWSIDSTERRQSEATIAEDWLQERLKQLSVTPYKQWTDVQFDQNCLIGTVHELEKEVMTIESCNASPALECRNQNEVASGSAESETADSDHIYDSGSVMNSRSSSFSSGPSPEMRGSYSDTRLYQRSRSLSIHRNSSSSMSCVSGFEASESSSMHDSDKIQNFMRKKYLPLKSRRTNRWPSKENVSSSCSSRSSIHDTENVSNRMRMYMVDAEGEDSSDVYQQVNQYNMLGAHDKQSRGDDVAKPWRNQCLITPKRMHIISDMHSKPSRIEERPSAAFSSAGASYTVSSDRRDTERYKQDIECDVFFSSEDSDTNAQNPKCGKELLEESSSRVDTIYGRGDPKSASSSRDYSAREDIKRYQATETRSSYITRSERQLFSDIRSLASSCQASCACEGKGGQCGAMISKTTKVLATSTEAESAAAAASSEFSKTVESAEVHENVSATVTSYKYKGTQGFGRKPKSSYRDRL